MVGIGAAPSIVREPVDNSRADLGSTRVTGRKPAMRPLDWIAGVAAPVRLVVDFCAIIVVNEVTFHSRLWPIVVAFLPVLLLVKLYSPSESVRRGQFLKDVPRIAAAAGVAALILIVINREIFHPNVRGAVITAAAMFVVLTIGRGALYLLASFLRRRGYAARSTLIVGGGPTVDLLIQKIAAHPEYGLDVCGVLTDTDDAVSGHRVGTRPEDLPEIVTRDHVQELILVPADDDIGYVSDCFLAVDGFRVRASLVPPLQDFLLSPSGVEHIGGVPLISLGRLSYAPRMMPGKRLMDIVGSALALLVLSPVLLATMLAIKIEDRGPVLFTQKRAGYRGRYFRMLKFRSMCTDAEAKLAELQDRNETDGLLFKIEDDPRITKVGKFIRRTSIDELPQLLNVLKGEMSLVGPRALPVEIEKFGDLAIKRLNVRPGCTGFWQTLGRSDLTYDEMVKLDLAYIQNWSIWNDVVLILKTIPALAGRDGAY